MPVLQFVPARYLVPKDHGPHHPIQAAIGRSLAILSAIKFPRTPRDATVLSSQSDSRGSDVRVLVDFDGTMVPGDVTDHILQSFAGPKWLELEARWQAGTMNSRDCLSAQVDLIRASRSEIAQAVNERSIDPDFPEFVRQCASRGIPVTVVSDGFDLAIQTILQRYNLDLPFFSNHLEWLGGGRWRLGFPHRNNACETQAGNCKCRQLGHAPVRTVVIGDGRSDFCAASNASYVLSKATLTNHCREQGLRHRPFSTFADVNATFGEWLAEARSAPVSSSHDAGGTRRIQNQKLAPATSSIPQTAMVN